MYNGCFSLGRDCFHECTNASGNGVSEKFKVFNRFVEDKNQKIEVIIKRIFFKN